MLCNYPNCSYLQHREWLPLAPFHRLHNWAVSRQRQFHPSTVWNDTDSQSVPVPRNQVSRLQRPTHRTVLPAISPHRSSSTLFVAPPDLHCLPLLLLQATESTWLTSRFYPCTDSNCISCVANISNCSWCNLANGSPAQLLRQRACLYRSRCSPIRATVSTPTDPTKSTCVDAHCNKSALPTPRTGSGLQVGRRIPARPVHRRFHPAFSQLESQQATEPT